MTRLLTAIAAAALAAFALAPAAQAQFDLENFEVAITKPDGTPATEAGSSDFKITTSFDLPFTGSPDAPTIAEKLRDVVAEQIEGLIGDTTAVLTCSDADFLGSKPPDCPVGSIVGIQAPSIGNVGNFEPSPVYNLEPSRGSAARLAWKVRGLPIIVEVGVEDGPGHNIVATTRNVNQTLGVLTAVVELWGVPADPAHDALRCAGVTVEVVDRKRFVPVGSPSCPSSAEPTAYLTLPRSCHGALDSRYEARAWPDPDHWAIGSWQTTPGLLGCEALGFDPEVSAAPTTNVAGSPSGFDFGIEIDDPGLADPDQRAGSDLKKAVVTLPEGMTVNPAAAGGLDACSKAELARETYDSNFGEGCPATSRVASVSVETPLLSEHLSGSIYLATPYQNPLGTLLAGYLVIKQPQRGISVKLAGRIEADPATGRLTASFDQNPQLPFSDLEVSFFGDAQGPLTTPSVCGTYEVRTELHPWSGNAPDVSAQPFAITQAPGGGPCPTSQAQLPHAPAFDAGSVSPLAGRHSPFVVNLRRSDGSQRFSTVRLTPPPGLTAKLAGTPYCPDAALAAAAARSGKDEQVAPSCPAASRIGSVFAAAGSGPAPYWAPGTAYLSGPYRGAPLSMAIVTPAVAGPFDLGVVVIRTALHVNPATAQISAVSDPIPEFIEGIPLDVRVASVRLDKPQFTLNGTSCNPFAVTGHLLSTLGALAPLHSRFQLGECGRLGFKPRLSLRLFGGVKRGKHQALRAVVRPRPGDANIGRTVVRMPRSAFLAQEHIRTICTRVQWAADACPKGAVYGRAIAWSPLLGYPLEGAVYLRSSDNTLPDLVADLRGPAHQPIRVELVGRTDSVKGALRNTFDVVPDAPVSYFRLRLFGGKKGLIVNSRNICRGKNRAGVRMDAQNGRREILRPVVGNPRCKKLRRKAKRRRAAHRRARQRGRGAARRSSLSAAWRTG